MVCESRPLDLGSLRVGNAPALALAPMVRTMNVFDRYLLGIAADGPRVTSVVGSALTCDQRQLDTARCGGGAPDSVGNQLA